MKHKLLAIFILILWLLNFSAQAAVPVSVHLVEKKMEQPTILVYGTLNAQKNINLISQASGVITKIHFKSGAKVLANQTIVELDDQLAKTQVMLAKARLDNAKNKLLNLKKLASKNAGTRSELLNQKAIVEQNKAQYDAEVIRQSFYRVKAPFSGILGFHDLSVGEYILKNNTLASLTQLDSLYADLMVPSRYIDQIKKNMKVLLKVDEFSQSDIKSVVSTIGHSIHENTHSFKVRVNIANDSQQLKPGLLAKASIYLSPIERIGIPTSSISYKSSQAFVYTVKDGKAFLQPIKVTKTVDDVSYVSSGLKPKDQVILSSVRYIRNGSKVKVEAK